MGERGKYRSMMEGVNSTMIYSIYYKVPLPSTVIKKIKITEIGKTKINKFGLLCQLCLLSLSIPLNEGWVS
jgi:hypothetical protein